MNGEPGYNGVVGEKSRRSSFGQLAEAKLLKVKSFSGQCAGTSQGSPPTPYISPGNLPQGQVTDVTDPNA